MTQKGYYIGTSGWSYSGWLGNFYPEKIKSNLILPYYAQSFDSVELNNSFYQIPKKINVAKWVDISPKDFVFSCKANRYITHLKRLDEVSESLDRLIDSFSTFEEKLGPILFQFPPYWPVNIPRLTQFIADLPKQFLYTFEFRHKSWFCEELYDVLERNQMSLCLYDHKNYQSPERITGSFIYMRMHGPEEEAYQGAYSEDTLNFYAQKFINWNNQGKAVYCYFDNDEKAQAPKDAKRLKDIITKSIHKPK